jgi:hypothetical protein
MRQNTKNIIRRFFAFFCCVITISFNGCLVDSTVSNASPTVVFTTTWQYISETYSFFELKKIDWDAIKQRYETKVNNSISSDSLFTVCAAMVRELRDGHSYIGRKATANSTGNRRFDAEYFDFEQGYEIHFSLPNVVKYLAETKQIGRFLLTGMIGDSIGYVYYLGFSDNESSKWQEVMEYFQKKNVRKIILDIRNNGGGEPRIATDLCGYFVITPTIVGYMTQKNGKGRNDFSPKLSLTASPRTPYLGNVRLNILINRSSYSASSYLSGMMANLPNVQLIGQITGGGGGGELPFELPNGWVVSVSCNYFTDSKGKHIENGVEPTIPINNTAEDVRQGRDRMLEMAVAR